MAGNTFIQIPANVLDGPSLRRFLDKLVLQIDVAFSKRGAGGFSTTSTIEEVLVALNDHETRIITLEDLTAITAAKVLLLEQGEPVVSITASYIVPAITETVVCKAVGNITVTLPLIALTGGRTKKIAVTNTTATVVTVLPSDSALVVGEASQTILEGEVLNFISDGTNWELGS